MLDLIIQETCNDCVATRAANNPSVFTIMILGARRGLLRDCENDGSFADDYLDQRARGLELGQPRGDGAAEEGGAEVERDAGEPDDEHPEGDALRPVPQDLERVARDLLRQDGRAVQHAGQQVDLG